MEWETLFSAIALILIIEGIIPFINPQGLRKMLIRVARLDDQTLRFAGLTAIVIGYFIWTVVR